MPFPNQGALIMSLWYNPSHDFIGCYLPGIIKGHRYTYNRFDRIVYEGYRRQGRWIKMSSSPKDKGWVLIGPI